MVLQYIPWKQCVDIPFSSRVKWVVACVTGPFYSRFVRFQNIPRVSGERSECHRYREALLAIYGGVSRKYSIRIFKSGPKSDHYYLIHFVYKRQSCQKFKNLHTQKTEQEFYLSKVLSLFGYSKGMLFLGIASTLGREAAKKLISEYLEKQKIKQKHLYDKLIDDVKDNLLANTFVETLNFTYIDGSSSREKLLEQLKDKGEQEIIKKLHQIQDLHKIIYQKSTIVPPKSSMDPEIPIIPLKSSFNLETSITPLESSMDPATWSPS